MDKGLEKGSATSKEGLDKGSAKTSETPEIDIRGWYKRINRVPTSISIQPYPSDGEWFKTYWLSRIVSTQRNGAEERMFVFLYGTKQLLRYSEVEKQELLVSVKSDERLRHVIDTIFAHRVPSAVISFITNYRLRSCLNLIYTTLGYTETTAPGILLSNVFVQMIRKLKEFDDISTNRDRPLQQNDLWWWFTNPDLEQASIETLLLQPSRAAHSRSFQGHLFQAYRRAIGVT